jgi:hypothetical protein
MAGAERSGHQRLGLRQVGNALQGIHHLLTLPEPLILELLVLQAAATAAISQQTGGLAALG